MKNIEDILSRQYTTPEIAKLLDITVHKVISFMDRGYLQPSVQNAAGHGSKRLFSFGDVLKCVIIKNLLDTGLSVSAIRAIGGQSANLDESSPAMRENSIWIVYKEEENLELHFHAATDEDGKPVVPPSLPDGFIKQIPSTVTDVHLVFMDRIHADAKQRIEERL